MKLVNEKKTKTNKPHVFRVSELSKCIVKPWLYIDQIFAVYTYLTGLNVYMSQLNRVSLQVSQLNT